MTSLNLTLPVVGNSDATEEPKIPTDFTSIQNWANGNIDGVNLAAAVSQRIGLNDGTNVRSGSSIISTLETRTNTALAFMTTPDRVQNISLPSGGLILVNYRARYSTSGNSTGQPAITLNGTAQFVGDVPGGVPALASSPASVYLLATTPSGATGITTGPVVANVDSASFLFPGSFVTLFAAAGTYEVGVQFAATSGSVTVANRYLYVEAKSF